MKRLQSLKDHWGMTFLVMALVSYFSVLGFSQAPDIDDEGDVVQISAVSKTKISKPELVPITTVRFEIATSSNPLFEISSQRVSQPNLAMQFLRPNFRGPPSI